MKITANQFQTVILAAPLDLESQIYNAALDSSPKNVWQSFLNWLNNLLNNDQKDQFDMVHLSKNIKELVEELDPQFFNAIEPYQIQNGIDNLNALKTKFLKNDEKGKEAIGHLEPVIVKLEDILIGDSCKSESVLEEERIKLEEKRSEIEKFFSGERVKQVFKRIFPREAARYKNDCISCFGFKILNDVYNEHISEAELGNSEFLLQMANVKKEALIADNKDTMEEIKACFNDPQKIFSLFFPASSDHLDQLNKGHLFFDAKHKNWLDAVIRNPESVQKRLQTPPRNSSSPFIQHFSNDLEQRKIQGELLKLRKV
ncbi:MAG: hypothetical protein WA347_06915 [Rhabdochlamydiaceae bacterium]